MTRALAIAMIAGLALAPAALAGSFCGIFVSTTGSDDIGGGLSSDDAVRTINYAIERAIDVGAPCVFVQQGVYTEIVRLEGNVQVIGGFDADWETGSYLDPEHQARIVGAVEKGLGQFVTVLALDGDSGGLTNLVIEGPDAMGSSGDSALSSYAVYIDGASVTLTDVRVEAGDGALADRAPDGVAAPPIAAPSGEPGTAGLNLGGCSTLRLNGGDGGINGSDASTRGGAGGRGGSNDTSCGFPPNFSPTLGDSGQNAAVFSVPFGVGGNTGGFCGNGNDGSNGVVDDGEPGRGGDAGGAVAGFWVSSRGVNGQLGANGGGGGGGGGSAGCDSGLGYAGASGGGGGAGGLRAPQAGFGGRGGGGSFGVFINDGDATAVNTEIIRGLGADGGDGGDGAEGQPGGLGGDPAVNPNATRSGGGGDGGRGGHSGAGGGGAGGPSIGVYVGFSASFGSVGLTVSGGAPGAGGPGGAGVLFGEDGGTGDDGRFTDVFMPARTAGDVPDQHAAAIADLLARGGAPTCDPAPCIVGAACVADLSGDGVVGPADLAQLIGSWGACP